MNGAITKAPDPVKQFAEVKEFLENLGWEPYLPTEHPRSAECLIESRVLGDDYWSGPIYRELMRDFFDFIINQASAVFMLPSHAISKSACLERDVGKAIGLIVCHYEFAEPPKLTVAEEVVGKEIEREYARQHPPTGGFLDSLEPTAPPVPPQWPAKVSPWTL